MDKWKELENYLKKLNNIKYTLNVKLKIIRFAIHESKLKVVPLKYALTPVYFIFSVMQSTFIMTKKEIDGKLFGYHICPRFGLVYAEIYYTGLNDNIEIQCLNEEFGSRWRKPIEIIQKPKSGVKINSNGCKMRMFSILVFA